MTFTMTLKRSIVVIPDDKLQIATAALKLARDTLAPYLVNLGNDEKRSMIKMGGRNVDFVSKNLTYATNFPQFQPAYFDLPLFSNNLGAFGVLRSLQQPVVQLADMLDDTMILAGSGAMTAALAYYQSVKTACKMNLPGAATIADDLAARFAGQGVKAGAKASTEA